MTDIFKKCADRCKDIDSTYDKHVENLAAEIAKDLLGSGSSSVFLSLFTRDEVGEFLAKKGIPTGWTNKGRCAISNTLNWVVKAVSNKEASENFYRSETYFKIKDNKEEAHAPAISLADQPIKGMEEVDFILLDRTPDSP